MLDRQVLKKTISLVLVFSLIFTSINLRGFKAHAQGPMTNSSTVVDFEALQNAATSKKDTDNDGVYDEVEKILGLDMNNRDTDNDGLDDYFECTNGLDPLNSDSNNDGVNDLYEITRGENIDPQITLDTDGDGIANVFDDDNDGDGIVDHIDISPFASMGPSKKQEIEVQTDGNNTFVNIQIRPSDIDEIIEYGRSMTWPEDFRGQVQNIDNKKDNFNISPFLKISETEYGYNIDDQTIEKYGYYKDDNSLYIPIEKLDYNGKYIGYQGTICLSENSGHGVNGKYINSFAIELSYLMTIKNDYLGQGMHTSGSFLDNRDGYKTLTLAGFDETRDRQFLNSSIGDLGDNGTLDFAVFYLESDNVDNGKVRISYDLYPDIYKKEEGDYTYRGEPLLNQIFEIDAGFSSVNKEDDGYYTYMSRYDFDIVDGEIICFYIDGRDTAVVYKATADGSVIDTGISLENGKRTYFYTKKTNTDFIGSKITDGAGLNANGTYFYLYSKEEPDLKNRDGTYLVVKKEGEKQKEIVVDYNSNIPIYKYATAKGDFLQGAFANTELSTSLDIYDVNQDGKDDLVMLSYKYGTNTATEYSNLYFISDIFNADLEDWKIVKKLDLDITSNEGYARSIDMADIDEDGYMDMVVINANKKIEKQYYEFTVGDKQFKSYLGHDEMSLSFDIDASYAIISREEILLSHETEFEITGVNIESQKNVDTMIFSHHEDEFMLGLAQAFEAEFVGRPQTINQALNSIKDKIEFEKNNVSLTTDFRENFKNQDDAIVKSGEIFHDMTDTYDNRAFILAMEKEHRFRNLDELAVTNENQIVTFDMTLADTIISKDMSLKWIINKVLASPQDILDMIDVNSDNIAYFKDYSNFAREYLLRLNMGSSNITSIGGDNLVHDHSDYSVDYFSKSGAIYGAAKIPQTGVSAFIFIATHTVVKEPASIVTNVIARNSGQNVKIGYLFKDSKNVSKLAKFNKFKMVGNAATGVGLVVDIAFSCYHGYMYGQELKALGASDMTVGFSQLAYSLLYSTKAVITTMLIASGPAGWVVIAFIAADMLIGHLTDGKYGNYFDKMVKGVVKFEVHEGTYISTFDLVDKDITRSSDDHFTRANDFYNEITKYKTIISPREKDSVSNTKYALDKCWVQIYDELESKDVRIDNNKNWTEDLYIYKGKARQKREFNFDNTARFDELGRDLLIENDVSYKYKIIESATVENDYEDFKFVYPFNPLDPLDPLFGDKITFNYNDKKKIYDYYNRDMYFDVLPSSFEVFFETYDLVDGTYKYAIEYEKNQLGCRDIDGDGLYVDENGNEIDSQGNILLSSSTKFDTDGDGLSDYLELSIGSDPTKVDTDNDGLSDYEEFILGTSPTEIDTDGDGLSDFDEVNTPVEFVVNGVTAYGYSDPLMVDTDGDLLSDKEERANGTNPASAFTYGGDLFDGNDRIPSLDNAFDEYYPMTDAETLEIDLNNHITDDNNLIFFTDSGQVDENGLLRYTYDKARDGSSFEINITASDSRKGILETSVLLVEDMDNPFITAIKLDNTPNDNISHIDKLALKDSSFEIIFNEDVVPTLASDIKISPIENEHLDVDGSDNRLSNSCNITSTTSSSISLSRNDALVENNISYRIDIDSSDIEDTNGNLLDRDYQIIFKMTDSIGPEILSISNSAGIDDPLEIEFNEPVYMKPNLAGGSYIKTTSGKSISGYVSDNIFTGKIKPNSLENNTSYTLDSNNYKFWDNAGNVFLGFDGMATNKSFTTSDVVGPYPTLADFTLKSPVPQWGELCFKTNILNGEIRIPFDENIKEGIDYESIALSYENNLYFYGSSSAEKRIGETAKKFILPYSSRIEGDTLIIRPDNYDPSKNYSVFVEIDSINDLSGSHIRRIFEKYRLRILARSPGVDSTIGDTGTKIIALFCTDSSRSKFNIVARGLNETSHYSDIINVVFNDLVVPNPLASINATLKDSSGNVVASNSSYLAGMVEIRPSDSLSSGEYMITIPANTFLGVGELNYKFMLEDEIDISIREEDLLGIVKVDEKLYLSSDYLEKALGQDRNLLFQWYRSSTDSFKDAVTISDANSYEYRLSEDDLNKHIFVSVTNGNVFEVSPASAQVGSAYSSYCGIDNISLKYNENELLTYDSNTSTYNLIVSSEKDRVSVSAEFNQAENMNVYINNIKDSIWSEEGESSVGLIFGDNKIVVESRAENRIETKRYTINVFRDKTLARGKLRPNAKSVRIENPGDNQLGQTLKGYYEYYDELNREEGSSIYKWYKLEDGKAPSEIIGVERNMYTIREDDIGTRLVFKVTPVNTSGVIGEEKNSNFTGVVTGESQGHRVSFDYQYDNRKDTVTGVVYGSTITEPESPNRLGHIFGGWYKEASTVNVWDFDNDTVREDMTLYADWTKTFRDKDKDKDTETQPTSKNRGVEILVNGKTVNLASVISTMQVNKRVTKITMDWHKLEQRIASEKSRVIVEILVNTESDIVIVELNGQMIKNLEDKQVVFQVNNGRSTYVLPEEQIDIDALSNQIGEYIALEDIKIQIEISNAFEEIVKLLENSDQNINFASLPEAVEFGLKVSYRDKSVEVSKFNAYLERRMLIPDSIDPNKTTTGIVIEPDGTVRHVPTKIIEIEGKYYAKIKSLTNGIFFLVSNLVKFEDLADHWAKQAIDDMASRMVISGVGNDLFEPNREITRAEFAAIIVRALGLKTGQGTNPFTDVESSDWYSDYVKTAVYYNLISGYENGKFGPSDKITREQAFTIIGRAMTITELRSELSSEEIVKLLQHFNDGEEVANYARYSIMTCIKNEIITGREGNLLAPKDNITRAEAAVIIRRLLEKSGLI